MRMAGMALPRNAVRSANTARSATRVCRFRVVSAGAKVVSMSSYVLAAAAAWTPTSCACASLVHVVVHAVVHAVVQVQVPASASASRARTAASGSTNVASLMVWALVWAHAAHSARSLPQKLTMCVVAPPHAQGGGAAGSMAWLDELITAMPTAPTPPAAARAPASLLKRSMALHMH